MSEPDFTGPPLVSRMRKGSDHVDISPEHDTFLLALAIEPQGKSETSWRGVPQSAVILSLLSVLLLVCLGVLLGAAWTIKACEPKRRRQAEERRRLDEEWLAVRTARRGRGECPRCGVVLVERDWYIAPTIVDDASDDDD